MALLMIALLAAQPADAQAAPPPPPPVVQPLPPQLTDPKTADRLADAMQGISRAFLDLPVGEVQAAVEGRPASRADKRLTVREMARRDDPNFDRNLERKIAEARPKIQASMRALATALPQVMQSLHQAREAIQRAAANMPDPNYPKR